MATQPAPPPKPKPHDDDKPEPHVEGLHGQEQPPVLTVADEQRERSAEIQRVGIDAWKAAHDERGPDDKPKQVPGVTQRQNDPGGGPRPEAESWEGSTRSTPEARKAQHRAAP